MGIAVLIVPRSLLPGQHFRRKVGLAGRVSSRELVSVRRSSPRRYWFPRNVIYLSFRALLRRSFLYITSLRSFDVRQINFVWQIGIRIGRKAGTLFTRQNSRISETRHTCLNVRCIVYRVVWNVKRFEISSTRLLMRHDYRDYIGAIWNQFDKVHKG